MPYVHEIGVTSGVEWEVTDEHTIKYRASGVRGQIGEEKTVCSFDMDGDSILRRAGIRPSNEAREEAGRGD